MKVSVKKMQQIVAKFKNKKILVIGDLILDHYVFGTVDRISPEAPVPVVWANNEKFVCGGAANVGLNLVSLGADVSICGVLGEDPFGQTLFDHIKRAGIKNDFLIADKSRPTTLKTRIFAQHQQMVRLDWESIEFLSLEMNNRIINKIKKNIARFDAVIIEDYSKGVVNPLLVQEVVKICKNNKKIITVDPKEEHFDYYENVTSLTPNLKEAQIAANMKIRSKDEIPLLGGIIMERLGLNALLITLGEDGMMLFSDRQHYHIPTTALEVFDVSGAGDTVIATYTLGLAAGASHYEAANIANFAAGVVVSKLGAAAITKKELLKKIEMSK